MSQTNEIDMNLVQEYVENAIKLVDQGGILITEAILKGGGADASQTSSEPDSDVVYKADTSGEGNSAAILTETDPAVEKLIVDGLLKLYPDHKFIGEENVSASGQSEIELTDAPTWIIDPIDGTMNFVHRHPLVCTSVALAINKTLVAGIVNNPVTGRMYTAMKGSGAYLRHRSSSDPSSTIHNPLVKTRVRCSSAKKLKEAMVLMEMASGCKEAKMNTSLANMKIFMQSAHAVRCPGPAALDIALVGGGSSDAFIHFGLHVWDMAAGVVIVREAGGVVYSPTITSTLAPFDMMSRSILVATSDSLAKDIDDHGLVVLEVKDRDSRQICNGL